MIMLDRIPRHCPPSILIPLLLALSAPALAGWTGDQIIAEMDRRMTLAADQFFEYEMVTEAPGDQARSVLFTAHIKGTQWRRLEFLSPGDVKGMRVLILSLGKMYVYLPAYRKIRRVASHVRDQGFMGSAFSHDDMSVVTYAGELDGKVTRETDTHWTIEATRKPESEYRYSRLVLTVQKDVVQPSAIEYFNDQGLKVKSEVRTGYECRGEFCNARVMTLTDHTRGNVTSTMNRRGWKVNTGVSDRHFTLRSLQRNR